MNINSDINQENTGISFRSVSPICPVAVLREVGRELGGGTEKFGAQVNDAGVIKRWKEKGWEWTDLEETWTDIFSKYEVLFEGFEAKSVEEMEYSA